MQEYDIELNKHFKPDEVVLMCGESAYTRFTKKSEQIQDTNHVFVGWRVAAKRNGATFEHKYIRIENHSITMSGMKFATIFASKAEANAVLLRVLDSKLVYSAIIEEVWRYGD